MGGTLEGGRKTRDTILARDPLFYKKIGAKGGRISRGGGFAADPARASEVGRAAANKRWAAYRAAKLAEQAPPVKLKVNRIQHFFETWSK